MDAVTTSTDRVEKRTSVRLDTRLGDPGSHGREADGRTLSDSKQLADGLLQVMESERARVATLLADEVVSVITMARYLIEDAKQRVARGELEETSASLQNASIRIRDATQQLVTLCSKLRPRVLDDLGLLPALAWYLRDFTRENRGIFVSPRITVTESDIPSELKLAVFRIVQAALSNVARHAKASAARVFLSQFEDELRLVIEDNGVGFDVERWRHRRPGNGGCGLGMIARWVEINGGQCTIEAVPRHGVRVQALWRIASVADIAGVAEGGDAAAPSTRP